MSGAATLIEGVGITAVGTVWGDDLAAFKGRSELPERKHLKLMTRAVQLGVAGVGRALAGRPGWQDVSPERRGLFVGARPVGAPEDLEPALAVARDGQRLDLQRFGSEGLARLHPLWLVKGLSNNIPGYACAYWDLRGPVANRCEGRVGGLAAIVEAARAVAEGRVDLAVAGGADCLLPTPPWARGATGEGAAFVVLERGAGRAVTSAEIRLDPDLSAEDEHGVGGVDAGSATGPLRLVRALGGKGPAEVTVRDAEIGLWARIAVGEASG